ncbi:MAG: flagellar type III secretion system pore protein FliP [Bryobacterales bacterium]|nr:flagellar type III secretion system pore protein FliP [Bryobacterales bacterium]MBV9400129.1 flagellar type III secretion system pore protein FliP [Bryobacterales bacterium]
MKKLILTAACLAAPAFAGPNDSLLGITLVGNKSGTNLSVPMQIVLLLTLLTLLPAIIMSVTPFLRVVVVLHFLRQALGTQTTPSNQVLVGLALFLSLLIIQPVTDKVYRESWQPLEAGQIGASEAWDRASAPVHDFLLKFAREKDIRLFMELAHAPAPAGPSAVPLSALVPAYVLSELKTAFQIGAVLFLPFLIIDLVVASVTLSVGMVQLPPVMVSAPFKLLLFVLVDGWNLVVGSLVRSFY